VDQPRHSIDFDKAHGTLTVGGSCKATAKSFFGLSRLGHQR
jgi:hypothetical protein